MTLRWLALIALGALTACSSAPRELPRLSDLDIAQAASGEALVATPEPDTAIVEEAAAAVVPQDDPPRGGLLGFFRRQADAVLATPPEQVETAALPAEVDASPAAPARKAPALAGVADVPFGTALNYGTLARVCDVPTRKLGKVVGQYPERGRAIYRIHDSAPGSTGQRSMYVTGFDDGCARQFTAALAIFGDFEIHEQLRYGLPADTIPYSETDDAYEDLKRRECRVRRGKPCGDRLPRLARTGTFLSVYERFEGSNAWKNLLLHDGQVLAFDTLGR